MKRLLILALFALAAWYGWNHRERLFAGNRDSEAILVNSATHAMLRVRLTVDGRTYVRDVIEPDSRATIPFAVAKASDFHLRWDWRALEGVPEWRGGDVAPGPLRSRCVLEVFDDGVTFSSTPMPTAPGEKKGEPGGTGAPGGS